MSTIAARWLKGKSGVLVLAEGLKGKSVVYQLDLNDIGDSLTYTRGS